MALQIIHRDIWFKHCKAFGWLNLDVRYAGVIARCDTAILLLSSYFNGDIDKIEELEEERLYKAPAAFGGNHYSKVATVSLKI